MYSIREAAINVLQAVAKEFGPDWAREHIVLQVRWCTGRGCVTPAAQASIAAACGSVHSSSRPRSLPCPALPLLVNGAQVLAMMNSDNYLHRMTVLCAIGALAGSVSKEVVHNSMLPAVVACSKVRARWRGQAAGCDQRRWAAGLLSMRAGAPCANVAMLCHPCSPSLPRTPCLTAGSRPRRSCSSWRR